MYWKKEATAMEVVFLRQKLCVASGGNIHRALGNPSYCWYMGLRDAALTCLIPGSAGEPVT